MDNPFDFYPLTKHPFSTHYPSAQAKKYVLALGAALYQLSDNSTITSEKCKIWMNSINKEVTSSQYWKGDYNAIKRFLRSHIPSFNSISFKTIFFYDLFYLMNHSNRDELKLDKCIEFASKLELDKKTEKYFKEALGWFLQEDKSKDQLPYISQIDQQKINYTSIQNKKILIVGNIKAGKSTLINSLIGYKLSQSRTEVCTNHIIEFHNKINGEGFFIEKKENQYDLIKNYEDINKKNINKIYFHFRSPLSDYRFTLIDTPGANNNRDISHMEITQNAIKGGNYDSIIYVGDARYRATDDEFKLLTFLKANTKKSVLFVLNQMDCFSEEEDSIADTIKFFKEDCQKIGFKEIKVFPTSALYAYIINADKRNLTQSEQKRIDKFHQEFSSDYYDLAKYITEEKSNSIYERTGIPLLINELTKIN